MGIFIYAVLGIGLIVLGVFVLGSNPEWWVPVLTFASGIFCLFMAFYKLDEEFGIMDMLRRKKADKIANGKFKPQPLNMVPMFIKAYEDRKDCGNGYIMKQAKSNILSGYKAILKNWMFVAKETNTFDDLGGEEIVEKLLFEAIEAELTLLLCLDDMLDSDYSIYCDVCKALGHTPRTKENLRKYNHTLCENKYEKAIQKIGFLYSVARRCVAPEKIEALVQGFCYLALSDNTVDESEYDVILVSFFDEDIDVYPKTWEQFKLEYR